ncbi:hypothetical protein PRIC2_007480 [Phytophthora ramorum]
MMAKNIDIWRVLFAALPDHYFKCKYCGTVRHQLPSSGYGKLMSHLKDKHAEYEADYLVHASSHAGTLHSFGFVNDKIANIYHWMETSSELWPRWWRRYAPPRTARSTDATPLRVKATRWSSTLMLERYVRIRDAIKHVDAVDDLVPKPAAHRCVISLVENLKTFNSICKKLQEDTIPMSAVRVLFDKMTEVYPVTEEYLLPDAHIVHSPAFESAVVKVAGARGEVLTPEELEALEPFELEAAAVPTPATSGSGVSMRSRNAAEDFATALLRSDAATPQLSPRYSPIVTAILPTSNLCERLLLQCKLVMTPQQLSLLPVNFEMIAFVRANRNF